MVTVNSPLKQFSFLRSNIAFTIAGMLFTYHTNAADLYEAYMIAEQNDPLYKQAIAKNKAILEQRPQVKSLLLPNISLRANTTSFNQRRSGALPLTNSIDSNGHGYTLSLIQPLFRWDRYIQLKRADKLIQQSNANLILARQQLMVRVAEAYFNILTVMDILEFAKAEKKSFNRQLDQAKQRFKVGLTAITDVQEAQAAYDRSVADEIRAKNDINNKGEVLREITGSYFEDISGLSEEMPLLPPVPSSLEDWTQTSLKQSLAVTAAMHAVDAAREQINIQKSGYLPTLDVSADKSYNTNGEDQFGGNKAHTEIFSLSFNFPLYQGGIVSSRTQQAVHQLDQQLGQLEQAQRLAQSLTRQSYLGVISGISQVNALNQAVISSKTALQATEAGFEVGTRTAVDVIVSERALSQSRANHAKAKYQYILNSIRLKQSAGILTVKDLKKINQWLN